MSGLFHIVMAPMRLKNCEYHYFIACNIIYVCGMVRMTFLEEFFNTLCTAITQFHCLLPSCFHQNANIQLE